MNEGQEELDANQTKRIREIEARCDDVEDAMEKLKGNEELEKRLETFKEEARGEREEVRGGRIPCAASCCAAQP